MQWSLFRRNGRLRRSCEEACQARSDSDLYCSDGSAVRSIVAQSFRLGVCNVVSYQLRTSISIREYA